MVSKSLQIVVPFLTALSGVDTAARQGNGMASNCGAAGAEGGGNSGGAILGELGEQAAAAQRRVSTSIRKAGEQRGVWVDPATQQVGSIAEQDPGAWAFGRL